VSEPEKKKERIERTEVKGLSDRMQKLVIDRRYQVVLPELFSRLLRREEARNLHLLPPVSQVAVETRRLVWA
jgi:hypothetical protein